MIFYCMRRTPDPASAGIPAEQPRPTTKGPTLSVSSRSKAFALVVGFSCHAIFGLAVLLMATSLYHGLQLATPFQSHRFGWSWDLLLLLQFPLLHSFLLSNKGRRLLRIFVPKELGSSLDTTVFALVASIQLLLVFGLWAPSQHVWWQPTGSAAIFLSTLYGLSWLLLLVSLYNAGLALQTGFLGWSSVLRGKKPSFGRFPTHGLFRVCRQPVYLAFMCIVWSAPTWTPDHLILALAWTGYCVMGPRLKEARFRRFYGADYEEYSRRVPYLLPIGFAYGRAAETTARQ